MFDGESGEYDAGVRDDDDDCDCYVDDDDDVNDDDDDDGEYEDDADDDGDVRKVVRLESPHTTAEICAGTITFNPTSFDTHNETYLEIKGIQQHT